MLCLSCRRGLPGGSTINECVWARALRVEQLHYIQLVVSLLNALYEPPALALATAAAGDGC